MQSLKNAPQLHLVWISAKHEAETVSGFHGSRLTPFVKINIISFSNFVQLKFVLFTLSVIIGNYVKFASPTQSKPKDQSVNWFNTSPRLPLVRVNSECIILLWGAKLTGYKNHRWRWDRYHKQIRNQINQRNKYQNKRKMKT